MNPSDKSPEMNSILERLAQDMFGRSREAGIRNNQCVSCGMTAKLFNDAASEKEFNISGLCQICQDDVFCGEEY